MTIETKEILMSEELIRKIEMICRFAYVLMVILNILKIQILHMLNHLIGIFF